MEQSSSNQREQIWKKNVYVIPKWMEEETFLTSVGQSALIFH